MRGDAGRCGEMLHQIAARGGHRLGGQGMRLLGAARCGARRDQGPATLVHGGRRWVEVGGGGGRWEIWRDACHGVLVDGCFAVQASGKPRGIGEAGRPSAASATSAAASAAAAIVAIAAAARRTRTRPSTCRRAGGPRGREEDEFAHGAGVEGGEEQCTRRCHRRRGDDPAEGVGSCGGHTQRS